MLVLSLVRIRLFRVIIPVSTSHPLHHQTQEGKAKKSEEKSIKHLSCFLGVFPFAEFLLDCLRAREPVPIALGVPLLLLVLSLLVLIEVIRLFLRILGEILGFFLCTRERFFVLFAGPRNLLLCLFVEVFVAGLSSVLALLLVVCIFTVFFLLISQLGSCFVVAFSDLFVAEDLVGSINSVNFSWCMPLALSGWYSKQSLWYMFFTVF